MKSNIKTSRKQKWIKQCSDTHCGKYDYSKVEYQHVHTKVTITCPIHGDFQQSPQVHKKSGCPECKHAVFANTMIEKYGVSHPSQSVECQQQKQIIMMERYGVANASQSKSLINKRQQTNAERYGVKEPMQSQHFVQQRENVCKERYGVSNVFQDETVKELSRQTCLVKYGTSYANQSESVREKITTTNRKRYGRDYPSKTFIVSEQARIILNDRERLSCVLSELGSVPALSAHLEVCDTTIYNYLKQHDIKPPNVSHKEQQLKQLITDLYQGKILANCRSVIPPYELDVYLPELNLAFEFNGVYWHSDTYKTKTYHKNKTTACQEKGVQLLHIWEYQWDSKIEIVKSIIAYKLNVVNTKIHARKTIIKTIDSKTACDFLDENHIQGKVNSSIRFGLYHQDILVSVMTFGKSRYANTDFELLRFANKINCVVVGGASKLFKHFQKQHVGSVLSYSHCDRSDGALYKTLGFEYSHQTRPGYVYYKNGTVFSRVNFQKHKLASKLELFDAALTEHENMRVNGYLCLWDSGNSVWVK